MSPALVALPTSGTFEERNLQVEPQVLPGTRSTQALAAGEVQISTGDALTVAAAVLNGLDLVIIATPIPRRSTNGGRSTRRRR